MPSWCRPSAVRSATIAALMLWAVPGSALPQSPCPADALALRSRDVYRDLTPNRSHACAKELAGFATDRTLPWDVRARALRLLGADEHRETWVAFTRDFDPLVVAATETGAVTFNLLADWLPPRGQERALLEPLLLPGPGRVDARVVLEKMAGQGLHPYLHLLWDQGYALEPGLIRRLAQTDDQDTRRFLHWSVGERALPGMESFLVDQLASGRASTYPTQGERLLAAAVSAGLSELFRAAAPRAPWLGDETTPNGLAVASLARLWPPARPVAARDLAARLAEIAATQAGGTDRAQWQVAADIVALLLERGESPRSAEVGRVQAALARQCLRKRGPLRPFALVEGISRRFRAPFPALGPDEVARVWDITLTTLDAAFLGAVTRALPDPARRSRLEQHLLSQAPQAADGSLRVVRCWGADIEGPGDWCAAVAELGLKPALPTVERVLDTAWPGEAVAALVRFGPPAVPALARFLRSPQARQIRGERRADAVRLCLASLPPTEREALIAGLRADPVMAETLRGALAEPRPR